MKTLKLRAGASTRLTVDREAGIIRGVAVITGGMTKTSSTGQGPMTIDATTLREVADAINARPNGVKVRITHPEISDSDDLPHRVGYITSARIDGDIVRADVEFHSSDDADARRIMAIAERDPASCGMSIVASNVSITDTGALRIGSLDAVDFVGEPAANPAGMLSATQRNTDMIFNDSQLAKLRTFGMTDEADAQKFYDTLTASQQAEVDVLGKADPAADPSQVPGLQVSASAARAAGSETLVLAERRRASTILGVARRAGLGDTWAAERITAGDSIENVNELALNHLVNTRSPAAMETSMSVYVGTDRNGSSIAPAISDALALRMGCKLKTPHPRAAEFRGRSIIESGRAWLSAAGVREAFTLSPAQVASKLMNSRSLALSMSTGDFPHLLADALGKSLRVSYELYPQTWTGWCGHRTTADFKAIKRPALHSFPTPGVKAEGDEIQYVSLAESTEVYTLKTYSNGVKLTREMLINDDLHAFDRLPQMAAAAARRLEDDLAYAPLTSNQVMTEDTVAPFATAHANIGTGVLSNAAISAGRVKMSRQTDLKSAVLNLRPAALIVPVTIEDEARALVAAQELRQTGSTDATYVTNVYSFLKSLTVVADPRLDADSTAQWYLAASPEQIDGVELAFLEGEETPIVEEEDDFDSDVRKLKLRHSVAARAIDFRGLYRSTGA